MEKSLKCKINFQSVKVPMRGHLNEDWSLLGSKIISKSGSLDNSKLLHMMFISAFFFFSQPTCGEGCTNQRGAVPFASPTGKKTTLSRIQEQTWMLTMPQELSSGQMNGNPSYYSRFFLGRIKLCTESQPRLSKSKVAKRNTYNHGITEYPKLKGIYNDDRVFYCPPLHTF